MLLLVYLDWLVFKIASLFEFYFTIELM